MRLLVLLVGGTLLAAPAVAGDVYVTKDERGNLVYTDRPATMPAQKVGIQNTATDPAAVQQQYSERMQQYAADDAAAADAKKAEPPVLTPQERAERCTQAKQRYDATMSSFRLYENTPDGGRRYLSSEEIDAVRAEAKKLVDVLCTGQ